MKDGRAIRKEELSQDLNGRLKFGSVLLTDSGHYTCLSDDHKQTYNAAVDVIPDDINSKSMIKIFNRPTSPSFRIIVS
jgi:hypothetical protein